MSLKTFYQKLEDKYFNFLDKLERKGINLYKIIDPLEKRGIRTFAIFNLIILGIIVLLAFIIFGGSPGLVENSTLTFVDSTNNPFSNQTFTLSFSGNEKLLTTDDLGISKVNGLNKKTIYSLELISEKYLLEKPFEIEFSEEQSNFTIYLKSKTNSVDKKIIFTKDGEQLTTYLLVDEISCSNPESTFETLTNIPVNDGELIVEDVPLDCGELLPSFRYYSQTSSDLEIDDSYKVGEISLSDILDEEKGSVTIIVKDKDLGTPVSNITVNLTNSYEIKVDTGLTNENGVIQFDNLNVGQYFISAYDQEHIYGELVVIDGESVNIISGEMLSKEIKLEKKIIGLLKLKIIDSDNSEAIKNVKSTLFKGDQEIVSLFSDEQGEVTFGLEENVSYKVTFDNENYTYKVVNNLRKAEATQTIKLDLVNLETIRGLLISVVDDFSKPVEFANIKLLDGENNSVLKTIVGDVYGKGVITNLDPTKTYKLEAVKGKFSSGITNPFMIFEREVNEQIIKMNIGEGTFNINIKDEFGEPISTGISIYDTFNDQEIPGKRSTTDSEGNTLVRVRADKIVYFVIDNYDSRFFTSKHSIEANTVNILNFVLPKVSNSSNIEFLGLFDNKGEVVSSVTPGQSVKARFLVNINRSYSQVVAHIRTGKGSKCNDQTNLMEEDSIYIKKIDFAGNNIYGGTTFTPCLGENTDLKVKINRDAKWFNVIIKKPYEGTYLLDADLVIDSDAIGTLPLYYRAEFHQANSVLRYPVDSQLGTNLLSSSKQSLYAYTKEVQIFTGQSNFCNSSLCYNFSIYNENTKLTKNIIDKYSAEANTAHKLNFNLNIAGKAIQNPTLNIVTGSSTVLKDYVIEGVGATILKGSNFDSIELGSLGSNDHINGTINFNITSDKEDVITFNLLSNGEIVFSKTIYLDIAKSKKMNLEMVPRNFVPFVPNDTILLISNDNNLPIVNADVIIKINNDQTIHTGVTDSQGLYGFILPALDLGDLVTVVIKKNGFSTINNVYEITNDLISVVPENLDIILDLSKEHVINTNFSFINNTALPLAITSLSIENKNTNVDFSLSTAENLIDTLEQINVSLKTSLTEEGLNLEVQQNIKTNILVTLNNSELNKFWTIKIPVNLRIVFGNALDSVDCLIVDPINLSLRTTNDSKVEQQFKITNNCKVGGTNVSLGKLFAKLDLENQKEIGTLSLYVNNKEINLEDRKEIEILNSINPKEEIILKIIFNASNIDSAVREPKILFTSKRVNQNGVDELSTLLSLNLVINKYNKCLSFPEEKVSVIACNIYSGQNLYNNYYGPTQNRFQNPQLYNNYGNAYSQGYNVNRYFSPRNNYNYGAGYTNQSYNPLGSPSYYDQGSFNGYVGSNLSAFNSQQYPNNFYNNGIGLNNSYGYENYNFMEPSPFMGNMGFSNNMGCPQRPIYVENNCSESLDLKFDSGYGVTVDPAHKEFTLEKGKKEIIGISGQEEMGLFSIGVSAKPTNDVSEEYSFVKNIPVDVSLPLSYMASQCIKVVPQKIDFSLKVTGYEEVKIINTCFTKGYRLLEVSFLDLNALSIGGVTFLDISENLGRIEPLKVSYDIQNSKTGEQYETWTIALKRNPEIQRIYLDDYLNKYKSRTGNIDAVTIISSLRTLGFDFGESVALKFMLQVTLQPPSFREMPIMNNIGMELVDNLQWLGLINKENRNIFGIYGESIDYEQFDEETLKFVDTSAELEYRLEIRKDGPVVFIKVPDKYLTKDKFKVLDLEDSSEKCFMGRINQFPIEGISTKAAYIPSSEKSVFFNNGGPVEVSIDYLPKFYFKLCFKRPAETLTPVEAKVFDLFKSEFTLMETLEDLSAKRLGSIKIGVEANLGPEKLSLITEEDDGTKTGTGTETETEPGTSDGGSSSNVCKDPTGTTSDYGFTSNDNYKLYGFDKLLFNWNSSVIDSETCEDYYCDQEQLYTSISKKVNNTDETKINGISFDTDDSGKPKLQPINLPNFCNECKGAREQLNEESTLDEYINASIALLKQIPDNYKKMTLLSVDKGDDAFKKFIDSNIASESEVIGNKIYFTLEDYLTTVKLNLEKITDTKKLKQMYDTLEIGLGTSTDRFLVKLKKFGNLESQNNKDIMKINFLNQDYSFELANDSTIKEITEPGSYWVSAKLDKSSKKITFNILSKGTNSFNEEYTKNPLFYYPINPTTNKYDVPFKEPISNPDYYTDGVWTKMQEGYILNINGQNDTEIPTINYYNSKPLVITNNNLDYNLNRNDALFKENHNKNIIFISNKDNSVNKGINYQLQFRAKSVLDFKSSGALEKVNNSNTYNVPVDMSDYLSKFNYNLIKDLIDGIKQNNVCFKVDNGGKEIKFWNNLNEIK